MLAPRPATDRPEVRSLCEELVPDIAPVELEINAPPTARAGDCTENVAWVIERHGGKMECGWRLWEIPDVLVEGEFHAIWVSDQGARTDVTPHSRFNKIIFLPDPSLVYEGRQINNVRRPLSTSPIVRDFISTADRLFEAMNRGDLADAHGEIAVTPEMLRLQQRLASLQAAIVREVEGNRQRR